VVEDVDERAERIDGKFWSQCCFKKALDKLTSSNDQRPDYFESLGSAATTKQGFNTKCANKNIECYGNLFTVVELVENLEAVGSFELPALFSTEVATQIHHRVD